VTEVVHRPVRRHADAEALVTLVTAGAVLASGTSLWLFAQERPTFRIKVDMVVLSFTVTDSKGHYINNLKHTDFRVTEDSITQKINTFGEGNKPPVQVLDDGRFRVRLHYVVHALTVRGEDRRVIAFCHEVTLAAFGINPENTGPGTVAAHAHVALLDTIDEPLSIRREPGLSDHPGTGGEHPRVVSVRGRHNQCASPFVVPFNKCNFAAIGGECGIKRGFGCLDEYGRRSAWKALAPQTTQGRKYERSPVG